MAEEKKAPNTRTSTPRKTTTKTAPVTKQVEANARHIEENAKTIENNSKLIHLLYGAIILLMMIIAGLAFFIGTQMGGGNTPNSENTGSTTATSEDVVVTIIDDARCNDCQTDAIAQQMQALPFLAGAEFMRQDFAEDGVSEYLEENNISALPAVIFNTNSLNDGGQIAPYLQQLPDEQYSLALGATFDPFAERSENGFLMAPEDVISQIQNTAHFDGNPNAAVSWLEFSDVNCSYCQKMVQDGTYESVKDSIPEGFNHSLYNFIGVGGSASQNAAEALECIAQVGGAQVYTDTFNYSLGEKVDDVDTLVDFAAEQGVDTSALQSCIDNGESVDIVAEKFALGRDTFGITGTPGNVIINMQTGEYEIISGAYPAETFQETITQLLGE